MRKKLNILNSPPRKILCFFIVLLISFNFSVGGVQAKICKGGPDCANCVELTHSHMPGDVAEMENNSCRPGDKNTTCGFVAGHRPDEANRIALTVRSDPQKFSGIFMVESDEYNRPSPSGEFPSQFDSPHIYGAVPIHLLNDSLLC